MPQTPERAAYLREYRARKKAEYAAKKAERDRRKNDEKAIIERTNAIAAGPPTAPETKTDGKPENKTDILNDFLADIGPKINPRPIQPGEKDSEGESVKPPTERGAVFIRGSLFRLIGIRLNKMFETNEFELSAEESDCLADALQGGLEYSHVSMNPWAAFGIMLLMWLLPLIWVVPAKMGWGKDKKKKGVGENDGPGFGLRPNRFFGKKVPTIDDINRLGESESQPGPTVPIVEPTGAPVGPVQPIESAIATRDNKLARAYDNSGVAANG